MSLHVVSEIKTALSHLDPGEVRSQAEKPITVTLHASDPSAYAAMEDFFAPKSLSHARRTQLAGHLYREGDSGLPKANDLDIYAAGLYPGDQGFTFYPQNPEKMVQEILNGRSELALSLARLFPAFRSPVIDDKISKIAKENALFSAVTAFPNILPSIFSLPWAIGEFASDTAVLTGNQIRLAFLIAAASDREVGYKEQRAEVASIIGGAFGWRAVARELVGKIPLGGGLIPKAAIAYAGTYVAGVSLERLYRIGYRLSRQERKQAYLEAFEKGRSVVGNLSHLFDRSKKEEPELAGTQA